MFHQHLTPKGLGMIMIQQTGVLLKGKGHKTWHKTVKGENEAGYRIIKRNGRYYSIKK